MKRLLCSVLAVACLWTNAFALSDSEAIDYFKLLSAMDVGPSKTYLVDFDGDGSEEFFAIFGADAEDDNYGATYRVYSGNKLIGEEELGSDYIDVCKRTGDNKLYLRVSPDMGDSYGFKTYTVQNGQWVLAENFSTEFDRVEYIMHKMINGQRVTDEEYYAREESYSPYISLLELGTAKKYICERVANANIGYPDIYEDLSSAESIALFDNFLCGFSGFDIDYRTASDYTLLEEILPIVRTVRTKSEHSLGLKIDFGNPPYGKVSKQALDKLTTSIFGRVFDGDDFKYENMPQADRINEGYFFWKDGEWWYQYCGGRGYSSGECYNKHLYDIGDGYYYAVQEVVWFNSAYEEFDTSVYAYIIKKNDDGSYRLIRTYKKGELLSQKDIDELVNPSDWAVDELGKAEKAGLAPKLDGEPFMTESATRLQFAQLAVSLAEKATGKSLASAPDTTFKDCDDIAVLKAYKAGIINGTSETEFSPNARLTREQLAAMIWRTVKYIQSETKKEKLTGGGDVSSYADAYDVSDYAAEAVAALSKNGIMKGTSETELSPKGNCSVEQSIILIYRTYLKIK